MLRCDGLAARGPAWPRGARDAAPVAARRPRDSASAGPYSARRPARAPEISAAVAWWLTASPAPPHWHAILQPRPHGRARQAQQQGHLLRRQHLFYRPLFRVRALPKRTETDPARLAAPGCSRLARRSWPAHRVARHDPSSTASSPCCPSSRAVCARSDCPWPRLARLTARDARRSLAQIAWSRSLAHSSNFRGGGEDLVTRLTAGAPAQASSGGICPRRFRAAPRPCAPPPPPRRPRTGPWARRRRLGVDGGEVAWCHVGRECPQFNVYKLLSTCS